jgi:hypothetical protein
MAMPVRFDSVGKWLAVDRGVTNVVQFVGSKAAEGKGHDRQGEMAQAVRSEKKVRYHCRRSTRMSSA